MGATPAVELQAAEVQHVLESGLFVKAPRLEKFFRYICERHLRGESDQLKEYSIAVEALDRGSDFDPKKDSIVRVEAHRLRKRLDEYYRGAGASHPVHVRIPSGQYRPDFLLAETPPALGTQLDGSDFAESLPDSGQLTAPASVGARRWHNGWLWSSLLVLACASVLAIAVFYGPHTKAATAPHDSNEIWKGSAADLETAAGFRLLAGYHGPPLFDRQEHAWTADAFYRGGKSSPIARERVWDDTTFLRTQRSGKFEYDIPLRQTTYELHLYMIETEYGHGNPKGGGEATRAFQVSANGSVKIKFLDPLAGAGGPNRVYERVLKDISPAADGILHLAFDPITGPALLNALEIFPSPPGRIHPIRLVAQDAPRTDSEGRLWAADEYFSGGTAVCRKTVVQNSEAGLYHGERYGNFSYRIPVAPGRYRLTLHFAETWFGTPQSHDPAYGSRIFNVFANGIALLRNYQVIEDAGGPNREVRKVFEDLAPNAQGLLLIEFVPVENYAEVNAIEVVETG
jgi:malectin (di-glucose binding ER protein)